MAGFKIYIQHLSVQRFLYEKEVYRRNFCIYVEFYHHKLCHDDPMLIGGKLQIYTAPLINFELEKLHYWVVLSF